jgi:hypothetical protein
VRFNPNRPIDERARGRLRYAVLRGDVAVAPACERCGSPNRQCSDGRRYLQAHHPDHNQPLNVEWLCSKCHRRETPLPCGERSGNAKLTVERVAEAIRLCAAGATYTEVARRLGVERTTIRRAVNGETWLLARSTPPAKGD